MKITYSARVPDFAELSIDGVLVRYKIPPETGTHPECFKKLSSNPSLRVAQGKEIIAYANGALVYRQNEWQNQDLIRFLSKNYLRFPAVMTIIPRDKERFGDLEGGMLIDPDFTGEGIEKQTEVPNDLSGWTVSEGGILTRDKRIFVPYASWYNEQWDEKNGAVIALSEGIEGAEALMKTSVDSERNYRPLWRVNPDEISSPEKRVPVLGGHQDSLGLGCVGYRGGCAVGVLK